MIHEIEEGRRGLDMANLDELDRVGGSAGSPRKGRPA
jgi:hypothetical protein